MGTERYSVWGCDPPCGYLLEVYFDGDHAELKAIACHARVLAHYGVLAVGGALGCGGRAPGELTPLHSEMNNGG